MNQIEKVATSSFNHFIEQGGGDMHAARKLFAEWVGEFGPCISPEARGSWSTLVVAIDWLFQDAGYTPT